MNHFNVHALGRARDAARWANALQRLAADTPHGIPVTISTDTASRTVEGTCGAFESHDDIDKGYNNLLTRDDLAAESAE